MTDSILPPPIDASHDPPYHKLDWQRWERLTVAVLETEPDIVNAYAYGTSGQSQFGIDVLAQRADDANEVASCKRTETIRPSDLVTWSDDFLNHWQGHWQGRRVRRFVLATTATNIIDRAVQTQVEKERERFRAKGIRYELWGPGQFTARLKSQRAIVAAHLPPWVDSICGPAVNAGPEQTGSANFVSSSIVAQLGELQRALSGQVASRADEALHALRAGQFESVRSFISELRGPARWDQLAADAQAKVIRLEASLKLREHALAEAEALARDARALDPQAERRLEAQIALERSGIDDALSELGMPRSDAGRQLLATLLLMKGAPDEAGDILAGLELEDAETWRLRALTKLALGDRDGALDALRKAESLAPSWIAVLQAGIIVRYARSLSAVAGSEWIFYPNPVESALVRQDEAAQSDLEDAIRLAEKFREVSDEDDADLWMLALLANRRNGHAEASAFARILLAKRPDDLTAIAWVINRQLDAGLKPSLTALRTRYQAGAPLMSVRLLGLLLINLEPAAAAEFLARHLDQQEGEAREEAERWIARISGSPEPPLRDGEDNLVPLALRAGRERGDWAEVARVASERLALDPPGIEGLGLAHALAEQGEWEQLKPLVPRILLYDTADAVRLAAYILYNNGAYNDMLELLERSEAQFGRGLPDSLRQLKVHALLRSGRPQESLREIEKIASPASGGMALLKAEAQASIGNVRAAVPVIREALRSGQLDGARALHWSQILQVEDPDLARDLWRAARGADEEALAVALVDQAYRLGLDRETAALMPQLHARAQAGTKEARLVSLDEVKELMVQWRETADDIYRQYQDGALPAHLAVRNDEADFLRIYAQVDPADPRLEPRLIRSGARPAELRIESDWQDLVIHLDISGLLLAEQLGLMDLLEQTREPVRVSSQLPLVLLRMERGTQPVQPTQMDARRQAWEAVSDGTVELVQRRASDKSTVTVAVDGDNPPPIAALGQALLDRGLATKDQIQDALGYSADAPLAPNDLEGIETLRFDLVGLIDAANAGLLKLLAAHFRLEGELSIRDALRLDMARAAEQNRLAALARKLRERVADNVATGRFVLLEPAATSDEDSDEPSRGPLIESLGELLTAPRVEHGVVWFDDRMISSYSQTATMPTVGTFEILQTLHYEGRLDDAAYRQKLIALRAAGACFIPMSAQDVLAALNGAPVLSGQVVETDDLKVLRRSFACAGRLENHLQIAAPGTANPHHRPDEIEHPRAVMRLLGECLDLVWKGKDGPVDVERAYAMSDWLWLSLREAQLNRPIPGDNPAAAQDRFEALQVGHLLDKGTDVGGINDQRGSVREAYLAWVWYRCVQSKAQADPTFLERIGAYLATFYRGLIDDGGETNDPQERRILNALVARRLQRLPPPVRRQVIETFELKELAQPSQIVTLGKLRFEPALFWRAVCRALRYGSARLRTTRGQRVRMVRDGEALKLSGPGRYRLSDALNTLIAARAHERPPLLEAYLVSLDLSEEEAGKARAAAQAPHLRPHELAAIFADLRETAPERRYDLLAEKLATKRQIGAELMFPVDAARMLQFAGVAGQCELDLGAAFETLKARIGARAAFARLSALPVPLGAEPFADFSDEELLTMVGPSSGPMPLIHVLAEARRRGFAKDRLSILVEALVTKLEAVGELAMQLLAWSEKAFLKDASFHKLGMAYRLALTWLHAGQLLERFLRNCSAPGPLTDYLAANPPFLTGGEVLDRLSHLGDAAAPDRLTPRALLYHALGYAFAGEDLGESLSESAYERLVTTLRVITGEVVSPELSLLARSPDQVDAMGSFLRAKPPGILDGNLDPAATRDALIDSALDALEKGKDAEGALLRLGVFAPLGLSETQRARLVKQLGQLRLGRLGADRIDLEPRTWRALLTALLPKGESDAREGFGDLARLFAQRFRRATNRDAKAEEAVEQLTELAASIAAQSSSNRTERLTDLLFLMAMAWPAAAGRLRQICENLLALTPAREGEALWRLHLQLGSMP